MQINKLSLESNKNNIIIVFAITLANFIIKTLFLGDNSYWLDEASQVFMSNHSIADIINNSLNKSNGPLYTIILKFWMDIFGYYEFSTRFLSVLFSASTVPILYFFAKKHWNSFIAIGATLIFTLSTWQTYYAHETRSYTLITLFTVISFSVFYNLLKKTTVANVIIYVIINTLLLYTHLTAILILFVQGIITLLYISNYKRIFSIWAGMLVSIGLLSIWFFNNKWFGGNETTWMPVPNLMSLYHIFIDYFNNKTTLYCFIALGIYYSIINILKKKLSKNDIGAIIWGTVPIFIIFITSIYYNPRFTHRYMLYSTPGLYLSLSIFIYFCFKNYKIIFWSILALILISMSSSLELKLKYNGNWRDAVAQIKKEKGEKDLIVSIPFYTNLPFVLYYDIDQFKSSKGEYPSLNDNDVFFVNSHRVLENIDTTKFERLFLVTSSHTSVVDPNGTVLKYAKENFKLLSSSDEKYRSVKVQLYNLKGSPIIENLEIDLSSYNKKTEQGDWYGLVSPEKEYCTLVEKKCSFIKEQSIYEVEINAETYFSINSYNLGFVISIESSDGTKSKQYKYYPLNNTGDINEWNKLNLNFQVQNDINSNDILKIYLWRKGEEGEARIKNLNLNFIQ